MSVVRRYHGHGGCQRELNARVCIMCMHNCTSKRRTGSSPCARKKSDLCLPCCVTVRNYQHNRYYDSIATSRTRIKLFTVYIYIYNIDIYICIYYIHIYKIIYQIIARAKFFFGSKMFRAQNGSCPQLAGPQSMATRSRWDLS